MMQAGRSNREIAQSLADSDRQAFQDLRIGAAARAGACRALRRQRLNVADE
jgi:hypothetical protein